MRFEKWQALGNDYLIFEAVDLPWALTPARIRRVCDPHTGIGADGVLLLSPSSDPEYVAGLRIFNPDGSEAELSGNGARQAVMYLRARGFTDLDEFAITTPAGPVRPRITGPHTCAIELGQARVSSPDYPSGRYDGRGSLIAGDRRWRFQHVQVGNPQCAIHCDWLEALDLPAIGPGIERHELFPHRTNVSWFRELERGVIRARIFERGVGETLSSGTGATGAAVAYHLEGGPATVTVKLDGGELGVEIGADLRVTQTGWAAPVYRGELSEEFVKELDETE
ncbi:MAG: diaminopimelate epimerase [Solirubrobacteraceae bacterium]|nr:diaminopimelate epimerase [Solirubrobacteraceae bacterium]